MTTVRKSALVPYSCAQMFQLVDDIEKYPEFLPWCSSTQVHQRDKQQVTATIVMAKGVVQKAFTTRNRRFPHEQIDLALVDGPFSQLQGAWYFEELDEQACRVRLEIQFEFANRVLKMAVGPVFSHITSTLIESFSERAAELYG